MAKTAIANAPKTEYNINIISGINDAGAASPAGNSRTAILGFIFSCIEERRKNLWRKTTHAKEELKQQFIDRLQLDCSVSPDEASDSQIYQVLSAMMVQRLKHMRQHFVNKTNSIGGKKVYYLSMEFLMGRSSRQLYTTSNW